jgi:hypothetical protein
MLMRRGRQKHRKRARGAAPESNRSVQRFQQRAVRPARRGSSRLRKGSINQQRRPAAPVARSQPSGASVRCDSKPDPDASYMVKEIQPLMDTPLTQHAINYLVKVGRRVAWGQRQCNVHAKQAVVRGWLQVGQSRQPRADGSEPPRISSGTAVHAPCHDACMSAGARDQRK